MYSVLFSFKRVLSHAGILINEKFSWYLSSFSFLHLNPIRFVSCFITVFSFIIFDTSECQHSHYLVIEKTTSSFWRILFAKSLIFFLLNLHWNIYDIKNTEQLKQSLNTDWNVLTSSRENIKMPCQHEKYFNGSQKWITQGKKVISSIHYNYLPSMVMIKSMINS